MQFSPLNLDQPGDLVAHAFHGTWLGGEYRVENCDAWLLLGTNPIVSHQYWANNPVGQTLDQVLSISNYDPGSRVNFTAVAPIPLSHGVRSTLSAVFFWARLVYALVYLVGVPWLRTVVWFVSVIGMIMIAVQLF